MTEESLLTWSCIAVTLNKAACFDYSSNLGFEQLLYCFAYVHYASVWLCVRGACSYVCECQTLTQASTAYAHCMIVIIIPCWALWAP